ncbi:MAG TPA: aryl-sulfate sulfotransferase, partial [Thermoanaerobaculia bacterium]
MSPKPLGTMIRWTATSDAASPAGVWFRFRAREQGGEFRMVRDFSVSNELDWTALDEGVFEVEVTARDRVSQDTATAFSTFELVPRVEFGPAVAPTTHPLVFIFSSPGCETGRARVRFESDDGRVQYTPFKPCEPGRTLNFYLAGLAPNSSHRATLEVEGARSPSASGSQAATGREVRFETGEASYPLALPAVLEAASPESAEILLQTPLYQRPLATDSKGQMLWYGPEGLFLLTRPEPGGVFFGLLESRVDPALDRMRKFDLVGMTLLETNAARVSEQLVAMGKRPITSFHHEARTLRNGNIALIAGVEQILTDVQRPGPVDVLADMIVV